MSTLDFDKLSREVRANTNRSTRNNNRINHIESKLMDLEKYAKLGKKVENGLKKWREPKRKGLKLK